MVFFIVIFIVMSFFDIICESCNQCKNLGAIDIVREPVWLWLRDRCISFSPMSADTVFSDIFTLFTVGVLSEDLKSFFVAQQCNQSCCASCGNQIIYNTSIFVLYISCSDIISTQFVNDVREAVLPYSKAPYCDSSKKHSDDISALPHFIILPTFLTTELSSNCIDQITFPLTMDILEKHYSLKTVVRSASQHFKIKEHIGCIWFTVVSIESRFDTSRSRFDTHVKSIRFKLKSVPKRAVTEPLE